MIEIVLIFLISSMSTYFIKKYALKKSFVAEVNARSSHAVATPHGGGVAIALTWFIGLMYLHLNSSIDDKLYYALMVGILLSLISFFDDIFELSAKVRLLTQSLVACLGIFFLGGLELIDIGIVSSDFTFVNNIFAFFLIVWFVNLYNFLDGIDGYAASEMIFLSLAGFILFGGAHFLLLMASVAGFLVWNWHKAKIFMGDVSSTLLGYNVAIFTLYYANDESINLWIWIALFALFWFDATLTLFRRFRNNESLSVAHKKHAYQRAFQSGLAHDKVVLLAMGLNILIFICVYYISNIFISLSLVILLLALVTKMIDKRKPF